MEKIFAEANEAARMAVLEFIYKDRRGDNIGACGFAWVTIDGKSPLANWCRKQSKEHDLKGRVTPWLYGSKGYPTGWQFWNPGDYNGQRVDVKEVGARAFRDKLAEYGIRSDVGSRLD